MPRMWSRAPAGATMLALRRVTPVLLLAGVVLAGVLLAGEPAGAQTTGTIKGRVINGTTGEPQAGVTVVLLGGGKDPSGGFTQDLKERAVTDESGRYSFTGLPAAAGRVFSLDARFDGGLFAGGAVTWPTDTRGAPVLDTTLRVWETTADPEAILIARDDMFVIKGDDGADVIETIRVVNQTDEAYIGRGRTAAGAGRSGIPTLSFQFPPEAMERGVRVLDSDIDIPSLVRTSTGLGVTTAIPPGQTTISFIYTLGGSVGQFDLSRRANYPTAEMSVYVEKPFVVESNRLTEGEAVTIQGTRYRKWSTTEALDPADSIQIVATGQAEGDTWLLVGAVAGGIVLVLAVAGGLLLRRRRRSPREGGREERAGPGAERDQLLVEIAELDLAYCSGDLGREEWTERRSGLKARLAATGDASRAHVGSAEPGA